MDLASDSECVGVVGAAVGVARAWTEALGVAKLRRTVVDCLTHLAGPRRPAPGRSMCTWSDRARRAAGNRVDMIEVGARRGVLRDHLPG